MISGDCQSTRFDELSSFEKERQKTRARVFVFGTSTRSFEWKRDKQRDQGDGQAQACTWYDLNLVQEEKRKDFISPEYIPSLK